MGSRDLAHPPPPPPIRISVFVKSRDASRTTRSERKKKLSSLWLFFFCVPRNKVNRRSDQLSYEATDVGRWSFVGSNVPVF